MYIVLLPNLLNPNVKVIADVKVDISSQKLLRESVSRKSHVTAFMTLPIDPIYQEGLTLNVSFQLKHAVKLVYSMYSMYNQVIA